MVSNPEITNYGAFSVSDIDINHMLLGDIDTTCLMMEDKHLIR
ncbi:MAG: hypothetical protein CM15mP121_2520 [Bacteroidota bacterium]|nr:MAG: hypothetical protein CM15mP121_2520 [Bacteroidota bacterium]